MDIPPKLIVALSVSGLLALLLFLAWVGANRKNRRTRKEDLPVWIDMSSHSDERKGFFSGWFDSDGGDFGGDGGADGGD
tara:strand:+ start:63 stop:299 length:237 start_codon:yes stop_codon:yes gene_type:complete